MIYLVQLDNAYKIGYAKNAEKRIKNLSATHVVVNLIDSKEGKHKDEKELHKLCNTFKIKNELFEIREEVLEIFKNYIPYAEEIEEAEKTTNNPNSCNLILPENYSYMVILTDKELAEKMNCSVKSIKRMHKNLIEGGYLEIQHGIKIFKNL
jgi:hypothetical protein